MNEWVREKWWGSQTSKAMGKGLGWAWQAPDCCVKIDCGKAPELGASLESQESANSPGLAGTAHARQLFSLNFYLLCWFIPANSCGDRTNSTRQIAAIHLIVMEVPAVVYKMASNWGLSQVTFPHWSLGGPHSIFLRSDIFWVLIFVIEPNELHHLWWPKG